VAKKAHASATRTEVRVHARKNLVLERALEQQLDDALWLRKHLFMAQAEWAKKSRHKRA
jgi:hypothetical protein